MMRKKFFTGLTAGAMILMSIEIQAQNMAVPVVGVDKVVAVENMESRRYTGLVMSPSVVNVVPRVSGEILEVGFKDGDIVKKGQVLYRLDPVQYEAAVKNVEAQIAASKARLNYAQNNYNRNEALYDKLAASLDTMESARSELEEEKATLMAAEAELISAKDNLKNTTIVAPMDSLAGVNNFTAGNYITPSSGTLVTLIQTSPIRVRFSISTSDYLSQFGSFQVLKENGVVKVTLSDGSVYPEIGEIELLNNEANATTDAIQVFARFKNADYKLITGSTVTVELSQKSGKSMPAVPPSAIMHDSEGAYVYVVDAAGKAAKRYVELGAVTPDYQLITGGLTVDETVISEGTHKTMDGMTVKSVAKGN